MRIDGKHHRSVELSGDAIRIIDQRQLPWEVRFVELHTCEEAAQSIREMWVRGAPLIGAVAAYGLAFALKQDASDQALNNAYDTLLAMRPTAINLKWALDSVRAAVRAMPPEERAAAAYAEAAALCDEDVACNRAIGEYGMPLIQALHKRNPGKPVQVLTHCNAGWLATVDYGTALAPIYLAHDAGFPVHVWVDETRPRNQGMFLTAWELAQHGIPHTVIADNTGGLLMREGKVDLAIVGTDRVARNGDVCNKIGTYMKALAAKDNNVPFYVALPHSTIDLTLADGNAIPIEERSPLEITTMTGQLKDGSIETVTLTSSPALNPGFDVTPARLITSFITEHGLIEPHQLPSAAKPRLKSVG